MRHFDRSTTHPTPSGDTARIRRMRVASFAVVSLGAKGVSVQEIAEEDPARESRGDEASSRYIVCSGTCGRVTWEIAANGPLVDEALDACGEAAVPSGSELLSRIND